MGNDKQKALEQYLSKGRGEKLSPSSITKNNDLKYFSFFINEKEQNFLQEKFGLNFKNNRRSALIRNEIEKNISGLKKGSVVFSDLENRLYLFLSKKKIKIIFYHKVEELNEFNKIFLELEQKLSTKLKKETLIRFFLLKGFYK